MPQHGSDRATRPRSSSGSGRCASPQQRGYFDPCVWTSLGGLGQGYLAYDVCWAMINDLCGPHHWLGTFALRHWAFGPSPVLEQVAVEVRE